MPPKGATSLEMSPVLTPTMPSSRASPTPEVRRIPGSGVGGQAELGGVGQGDRSASVLKRTGRRRAEGSSRATRMSGVTSASAVG